MKPGFCFNHNGDCFPHRREWRTDLKPRAPFCPQLSTFIPCPARAHVPSSLVCSSSLCSCPHSFLAHRMAELMQPSTFCRSCFVPIIQQVSVCSLPRASTVLGAGKTAANKADSKGNRNPSAAELHWRAVREGAQRNCSVSWDRNNGRSEPRGNYLETCSPAIGNNPMQRLWVEH